MSAAVSALVARLRHFNAWRRDHDGELEQPSPRQVGADIDAATDALESMERRTVAVRAELVKLRDGYKSGWVREVAKAALAALDSTQ